jgi:hypothetical protein
MTLLDHIRRDVGHETGLPDRHEPEKARRYLDRLINAMSNVELIEAIEATLIDQRVNP